MKADGNKQHRIFKEVRHSHSLNVSLGENHTTSSQGQNTTTKIRSNEKYILPVALGNQGLKEVRHSLSLNVSHGENHTTSSQRQSTTAKIRSNEKNILPVALGNQGLKEVRHSHSLNVSHGESHTISSQRQNTTAKIRSNEKYILPVALGNQGLKEVRHSHSLNVSHGESHTISSQRQSTTTMKADGNKQHRIFKEVRHSHSLNVSLGENHTTSSQRQNTTTKIRSNEKYILPVALGNQGLKEVRHSLSLNVSHGENHTTSSQRQSTTAKIRSNEKYILPVALGNQGLNNQLQAFKITTFVAHKRNLTIVLSPFFTHGSRLEEQIPRTFEESFDGEALGKFVPVITLDEFKERCNNTVEAVFAGLNGKKNQTKQKKINLQNFFDAIGRIYYNHTRIRFPSVRLNVNDSDVVIRVAEDLPYGVNIHDFLDRYPQSLTTTKKCNAFIHAYGYLNRLPYWVHTQRYNQYFQKSPKVKAIVQHFIMKVLKNSSYVGAHWRFNEEWNKAW